jgi:signal transduction histidine kinase
MKHIFTRCFFLFVVFFSLVFQPGIGLAGDMEEAEHLVQKAVEYIKANGVEDAIKAFNNKEGEFVKGELYVFMFEVGQEKGSGIVCLAHPINPGLIGKDLYNLKDPNGTQFVVAMAKKAMDEKGGWVDYKWTHPITKKIGDKSSYALPATDDTFVGCGIYK